MTPSQERIHQAVEQVVRDALPEYQYLALYDGKVLADHGDQTLDIEPVDPTWPRLTRVPYELPFPGARVLVKPGAYVKFGFEAGDMRRPHCLAFVLGDAERIAIQAGGPGMAWGPDQIDAAQPVVLSRHPRAEMEAATKQYVDAISRVFVDGTITGAGSVAAPFSVVAWQAPTAIEIMGTPGEGTDFVTSSPAYVNGNLPGDIIAHITRLDGGTY